MAKKIKLKNVANDISTERSKSQEFDLMFKIESAKLSIAHRLAGLREEMGLTQQQLAKRMGVKQQLVSRIESGSDNITIETIVKYVYSLDSIAKIHFGHRTRKDQNVFEFA